ncbi:MAG TPA: YeeE/YedE thiosulfate transporter family protein [Thermodesulfobacteriota bacterium]|nr:YeeE/YedE thiosulfate transporter family protein [Thermodesulfobacteriota bacterium]
MNEQWLGLITGILFGALLQQGRVLRFEKQVGAMLLKDMTILKFMLSAIIVGMIGINLLASLGLVALKIKATQLGAILAGGILFGAGWSLAGYCPGTSIGAVAEGRWHAVWAILGMLAGAALFAETYPFLKGSLLAWGNFRTITLPGVLGISPWAVIPLLTVVYILIFVWFEKKGM